MGKKVKQASGRRVDEIENKRTPPQTVCLCCSPRSLGVSKSRVFGVGFFQSLELCRVSELLPGSRRVSRRGPARVVCCGCFLRVEFGRRVCSLLAAVLRTRPAGTVLAGVGFLKLFET